MKSTFCHLNWNAYLFLIKKSPKVIFLATFNFNFGNLRQGASAFNLITNLSQHGTGELSVNKWENNVSCITYLKK